jgi:hypothetical protein
MAGSRGKSASHASTARLRLGVGALSLPPRCSSQSMRTITSCCGRSSSIQATVVRASERKREVRPRPDLCRDQGVPPRVGKEADEGGGGGWGRRWQWSSSAPAVGEDAWTEGGEAGRWSRVMQQGERFPRNAVARTVTRILQRGVQHPLEVEQ